MRPSSAPAAAALAAACVAAAGLAARAIHGSVVAFSDASELAVVTTGVPRLREAMAALPGICSGTGPRAMFLGTSMTLSGVSPEAFDAAAAERGRALRSYNLAVLSPDPTVLRLMAERVARACPGRLDVAFLEFAPQTATRRFHAHRHIRLKVAALAGPRELAALAASDPELAASAAALQALGGAGAVETSWLLRRRARKATGNAMESPLDRLAASLRARRGGQERGWYAELRGETRYLYPHTREAYVAYVREFQQPDIVEADARVFEEENDARELRFDGRELAEFERAARALRGAARRVVVLVLPPNPLDPPRTPAGEGRLAGALARVGEGTELWDLSAHGAFLPEDYEDSMHLNELTGRPKLARLLARLLSERFP
jgi:hypothetical protein